MTEPYTQEEVAAARVIRELLRRRGRPVPAWLHNVLQWEQAQLTKRQSSR
jgi:hypothetical protein